MTRLDEIDRRLAEAERMLRTVAGLLGDEWCREIDAFLAESPLRLSAGARDALKPPPPDVMVDARHDCVHRDPGKARAADTIRGRKRD